MRKFINELKVHVATNPFAWVLFGLFLIAEYNNYQKGVTITRLCELTGDHNVGYSHPTTDKQELDTICVNHQPND